jgi:hypothetical protein
MMINERKSIFQNVEITQNIRNQLNSNKTLLIALTIFYHNFTFSLLELLILITFSNIENIN